MSRVNALVCDECMAAIPYDYQGKDRYMELHTSWHKSLDERYKLLLKSLYKDILDLEVAVAQLPSVIEAKQMEGESNA